MPGATRGDGEAVRDRALGRIRLWLGVFVSGLVFSGLTAIPLETEIDALVDLFNARAFAVGPEARVWAVWLLAIDGALNETSDRFPMLFYGTDWLAFGHLMIALAFYGAFRDPVRNIWLFDYGLLACGLVIPWALVFGELRGIPMWWRLIDCSFGVLGAAPLMIARQSAHQLASQSEFR